MQGKYNIIIVDKQLRWMLKAIRKSKDSQEMRDAMEKYRHVRKNKACIRSKRNGHDHSMFFMVIKTNNNKKKRSTKLIDCGIQWLS